jgi:hypothetical protein
MKQPTNLSKETQVLRPVYPFFLNYCVISAQVYILTKCLNVLWLLLLFCFRLWIYIYILMVRLKGSDDLGTLETEIMTCRSVRDFSKFRGIGHWKLCNKFVAIIPYSWKSLKGYKKAKLNMKIEVFMSGYLFTNILKT